MKDDKLQVLVVDDEADVRLVMNDLLEEQGYSVTTASSAVEAMSFLDLHPFDVILLDVHMPGKGGDEVLRYIRSVPELSALPVILVSASREAELDLLDVYDFISKPVNFAELFADLEEIASRRLLQCDRFPELNCVDRFTDDYFNDFTLLLDKRVGLSIPGRRKAELARVICSRVRALLIDDFKAYRRFIGSCDGEEELKKLVLFLTIGETYFFRNSGHFSALEEKVFPALKQQLLETGQKNVKLLSCGCSTGEEAYSLAIAAKKFFPSSAEWNVTVTAIDLNDRSIRMAKDGLFSKRSFRGVDDSLRKNYFRKVGDQWKVSSTIKNLVTFRFYNICDLCANPPPLWLRNIDVIFCRNVMIYFVRHRINAIIDSFHQMLVPHGHLFLGHSENRFATEPGFSPVVASDAVYFKRLHIESDDNPFLSNGGCNQYDPSGAMLSPQLDKTFSLESKPAPLHSGNTEGRHIRDKVSLRPPTGTHRPASGCYNRYKPVQRRLHRFDSGTQQEALSCDQVLHLFKTGISCISDEDYSGATEIMERIFRTEKENPLAIVLSAFLLSSNGQDKLALKRINDALLQDIGLAYAYFLRAGIRERHLSFDLAHKDYASATKWDPEFTMAFVNHGFVAEKRGQAGKAAEFFGKALQLVERNGVEKILFSGGTDVEALKAMLRGKVE